MMRKHLRYDAPDKGRRRTRFRQNFVSSSLDQRFNCKQQTTTKKMITTTIFDNNIYTTSQSSHTTMTTTQLSIPINYQNHCSVISTTSTSKYICLSIVICVLLICHPSNQLENPSLCPKVCTCDESSLEVTCNGLLEGAGLPHTLNPSTKRITINHGQTNQLTSSDLDYFRSLELLDLAFNKLTAIDFDHIKSNTYLMSLNASHNNIIELRDSAVMTVFSKLPTSSLISNLSNLVESDELKRLRKVKISVVDLDISYNQLTILRNSTLIRWHRLQKLYLAHNLIEVMEPESLLGLTRLEILDLRGNRISQLPANALQNTARSLSYASSIDHTTSPLTFIDLSENPLSSINDNSFTGMSNVRELFLDSCLIGTIEQQAFKGLSSVTMISLTNNELVEVPTDALSFVPTLKALKLNANDIRKLYPYSFKNLNNLEELQMRNGSLFEVGQSAFYGLDALKNLQLDYNPKLARIGSSVFTDLPKLIHMSVQMGSLTSLHAGEDITRHPIAVVDLRFNPLICDCNLKWLTNLLKRANETLTQNHHDKSNSQLKGRINNFNASMQELLNITCYGPSALVGKQIINLPDNKLECLKPGSQLNVHIGFASLFLLVLVLASVCLMNICRNEKHLMGILKENLVHNRIAMMLPYGHEAYKSANNLKKETHIECAEYEPIDYGQSYGPIYTIPADQQTDDSSIRHQTQQL